MERCFIPLTIQDKLNAVLTLGRWKRGCERRVARTSHTVGCITGRHSVPRV